MHTFWAINNKTCIYRFSKMEAGDGDISDYFEWQRELKEKAAAEEVAERERRHLVSRL